LVNLFIRSIQHVFETMANLNVTIEKPEVKTDHQCDVSSVISFSGGVTGAVTLCFPTSVAGALASAFAGEEMDLQHPDFRDAIGELANMVAGNAKSNFDLDEQVNISLPSVTIGGNHSVDIAKLPPNTPQLVIPCHTEKGAFHVEVVMINVSQKQRSYSTVGANKET